MLADYLLPAGAATAEAVTYEVFGMPPPSSGGATMGLILNLLEVAMTTGEFPPLERDDAATREGGTGMGALILPLSIGT